jgi:hypothetical protein
MFQLIPNAVNNERTVGNNLSIFEHTIKIGLKMKPLMLLKSIWNWVGHETRLLN